MDILDIIISKAYLALNRAKYAMSEMSIRFKRIIRHFDKVNLHFKTKANFSGLKTLYWFGDLVLMFLELMGIPEIYETIMDLFKFKTRPLYDWEIALARNYFGDSIRYHLVRIDERSYLGPLQFRFCYVSFHTINTWGKMENATFLHELIHVWQYERIGIRYIPKCLHAQYSKLGYNYGGVAILEKESIGGIWNFNLEQMGEIVSDAYKLKNQQKLQWEMALDPKNIPIYERYLSEIKQT